MGDEERILGECILAMYDIRGKQDFIYKSNKIREIVGGSYLIRDCFDDCLFPAARDCSERNFQLPEKKEKRRYR